MIQGVPNCELEIENLFFEKPNICLTLRGKDYEYIETISTAIRKTTTLQELCLSYVNRLHNWISILDSLQDCKTCKKLEFSNSVFQDTDIKYLLNFITTNKTIESLYLIGCWYTKETFIIDILSALKHNNTLKSLYIQESEPRGFVTSSYQNMDIEKMLGKNNTLKILHLGNNGLGTASPKIVNCLLKNYSLKSLNILNNNIWNAEIVDMAANLRTNTTLEYLNLLHNRITGFGFVALFEAISTNQSLKHLEVYTRKLSDKEVLLIEHALKKNRTLTAGSFFYCDPFFKKVLDRNINIGKRIAKAVYTCLCIRFVSLEDSVLKLLPKDVFKIVIDKMWKTRNSESWDSF